MGPEWFSSSCMSCGRRRRARTPVLRSPMQPLQPPSSSVPMLFLNPNRGSVPFLQKPFHIWREGLMCRQSTGQPVGIQALSYWPGAFQNGPFTPLSFLVGSSESENLPLRTVVWVGGNCTVSSGCLAYGCTYSSYEQNNQTHTWLCGCHCVALLIRVS